MRDLFFTILAIWVLWRIFESLKISKTFNNDIYDEKKKEGEVSVDYMPPKKKDKDDNDGEYVDYEEIK